MKTTPEHNQRIAQMAFASVYPHYITKVVSKGKTKEELHQVIQWLAGFDEKKLQELIENKATFEEFFKQDELNPNAIQIKGVICGYRVEEIENPITRQIRYLDKLVEIREMLQMSVLVDHDVIDGALMARFISELSGNIEKQNNFGA